MIEPRSGEATNGNVAFTQRTYGLHALTGRSAVQRVQQRVEDTAEVLEEWCNN
jgi:hypothetical protein